MKTQVYTSKLSRPGFTKPVVLIIKMMPYELMFSLFRKAIKLLPRTVNELSTPVFLFRCCAPLLLGLQLSIARPSPNKDDDSASAEEIID